MIANWTRSRSKGEDSELVLAYGLQIRRSSKVPKASKRWKSARILSAADAKPHTSRVKTNRLAAQEEPESTTLPETTLESLWPNGNPKEAKQRSEESNRFQGEVPFLERVLSEFHYFRNRYLFLNKC